MASVTAALVTLVVTALFPAFAGLSVLSFVHLVLTAAFRSPAAVGDVVALATPLMLTGLASTLTFRVGLINLGAEGQLIAAALAALVVGAGALPIPSYAIVPLAIIAGSMTGAVIVALVAALKIRLRADEAIITMLLNIVMLAALQLMTGAAMWSLPPIGTTQVLPLANTADVPDWAEALQVYVEPLVAVGACLLSFGLIRYTIWGLDIRATGGNAVAARFAGIQVNLVKIKVALLSGALVGLAGAGQVFAAGQVFGADKLLGVGSGATSSVVLGLGYAGIAVAFLAALEPLGVIPAALFVAVVIAGIKTANQDIGLPLALGSVTIALLLIATLIAHACVRYRLRPRGESLAS
jgi:simple sugar transport system permease protein